MNAIGDHHSHSHGWTSFSYSNKNTNQRIIGYYSHNLPSHNPWVDASIPPFLGRACATLRRILRGQRLSAPGGEDQQGPCGTHLGDDLLVTHGDFSGGLMGFFFMTFHRDFMGMSHLIFNGILLPIGDTWHLLKFGVSKGHSVGNQSNNLPFLELVAAFWLNWVRDGWRGVMFGFHFTFNVHSGWILLPCLGSTTSTLPWGCQFSQALAARKL